MSDTIRVVRVPGKVYPDPRIGRDFIGLRRARARDETLIVHRVPDGFAYVDDGPQEIPNTREIRQALADGDLALATDADAAPTPRRAREERRG